MVRGFRDYIKKSDAINLKQRKCYVETWCKAKMDNANKRDHMWVVLISYHI